MVFPDSPKRQFHLYFLKHRRREVPKTPSGHSAIPGRGWYNQNRVQITYSKILSSLKDYVPQSTLFLNMLNHNPVPDNHLPLLPLAPNQKAKSPRPQGDLACSARKLSKPLPNLSDAHFPLESKGQVCNGVCGSTPLSS